MKGDVPGYATNGLYLTYEKVFSSRGPEPKTGESELLRSWLRNCYFRLFRARGSLAVASTPSGALVGARIGWIVLDRGPSETGLAAYLEQILDEGWLAYGAHRQPGDYGGVVLRSCNSHCAPVPDIGKRSVAPITRPRSAQLLD